MRFRRLLGKELRGLTIMAWPVAVIYIGLDLFLQTRVNVWGGSVADVAVAASAGIVIWPVIALISSLHSEWSANTIYLLLSLPVKGWQILGAKLTAVMLWFAALGAIRTASLALNFTRYIFTQLRGSPIDLVALQMFYAVIALFAAVLIGLVLTEFSFLASHLVTKVRGLAGVATFFASAWLFARAVTLGALALSWMPAISLRTFYISHDVVVISSKALGSGYVVAVALMIGFYHVLSSWLIDRQMEV